MDEDRVLKGIKIFRPGDLVAVASRAACSKIRPIDGTSSRFDTSWCFDKILTVDSVSASGELAVVCGGDTRCTVETDALIKIQDIRPGDLVKIVDDIRGDGNLRLANQPVYSSKPEIVGQICFVARCGKLEADDVTLCSEGHYYWLSRLHVEFVARPICGYIIGCFNQVKTHWFADRRCILLEAFQDCMIDHCEFDLMSTRPVDDVNMKILAVSLN